MSFLSQGPLFLGSLVFMLGVVVIIHELGHYLAGRMFNAAAESFSVGFGKPVFERTDKRGTRWRLNWIPLGGFVKFVGESQLPNDVGREEQGLVGRPFMSLGVGARSVIAVAGPLANFILAALLFAIILFFNGSAVERLVVSDVNENSPAEAAGFIPGDVITHIKDKPVTNRDDFVPVVQLGAGEVLPVIVNRDGVEVVVTVTPERIERDNGLGQIVPQGTIGVEFQPIDRERRSYSAPEALLGGILETGETLRMTTWMIGRMATGQEPISSLTGPIGIGDVTRRVVNGTMDAEHVPLMQRLTFAGWTILKICALVSVGIGFFNLLPLPVLDGGHLVFNAYEAIAGKALPERIQEAFLTAGVVLLGVMFLVVTWGDILETGILNSVGG